MVILKWSLLRMTDGWNWFIVVSSNGFETGSFEFSVPAIKELP
jgi:hypothetical protein